MTYWLMNQSLAIANDIRTDAKMWDTTSQKKKKKKKKK